MMHLLIANRGEIAIRIARAAAALGADATCVYSEDDAGSLHRVKAPNARALQGRGPAAYLDADQLLELAAQVGATAVHPGYGFLSESADFARGCEGAGLAFVGPTPQTLALLGDKARARSLAAGLSIPTLLGSEGPVDLPGARAFLEALAGAPMLIKAVAGGGGRGMRIVGDAAELPQAYERCRSEAQAAFGSPEVYVEQLLPRARHVEVQVVGDGQGGVTHLFERECSLQRRHQKLVEVAPSPTLSQPLRERLLDAALRMGRETAYRGLGTFEFLVDADASGAFYFIEANPRLQVEHTVTEEVAGVDLVQAQLRIAAGASLAQLGLPAVGAGAAPPEVFAVQVRVNPPYGPPSLRHPRKLPLRALSDFGSPLVSPIRA